MCRCCSFPIDAQFNEDGTPAVAVPGSAPAAAVSKQDGDSSATPAKKNKRQLHIATLANPVAGVEPPRREALAPVVAVCVGHTIDTFLALSADGTLAQVLVPVTVERQWVLLLHACQVGQSVLPPCHTCRCCVCVCCFSTL